MQVELTLENGIAVLCFDDGKKNAFTLQALEAINAALDEAEQKNAKAIVLAGRPGAFCAGFHLATMTGSDACAATDLGVAGGQLATRLFSEPKPVVAACTGHAFTIGAFCLLACDTRIGTRGNYKYGFNETALGMMVASWGLELIKARLNPSFFIPTVTQAKLCNPEEALQVGFIDELTEEGETIALAIHRAEQLAELPAEAYAANKLIVREQALAVMRYDVSLD